MSLKLVISAGEASGDEHAAKVLKELAKAFPDLKARGMGGTALRSAGAETLVDSEKEASVHGFAELLGSLGKIFRSLAAMKQLLREWEPDLLIVVDYQDFHFRLIRTAKKLGIPVLFFISPSVWAWRKGRIKLVEKYVDRMAVIFPFEQGFYEKHGCFKTSYVGHPFAEEFALEPPDSSGRRKLKRDLGFSEEPLMAIAPGSRKAELELLLPNLSQAIWQFQEKHPEVQFALPVAPGIDQSLLTSLLGKDSPVVLFDREAKELYLAADAGLIKSGTSNLIAAFSGLPFSMIYKAKGITPFIVRKFVSIQEYSMVNIIRPGSIREIVQEELQAEVLSDEMEKLLFQEEYREEIVRALKEAREALFSYDKKNSSFHENQSVYERVALLARELYR